MVHRITVNETRGKRKELTDMTAKTINGSAGRSSSSATPSERTSSRRTTMLAAIKGAAFVGFEDNVRNELAKFEATGCIFNQIHMIQL